MATTEAARWISSCRVYENIDPRGSVEDKNNLEMIIGRNKWP